MIWNEKVVNYNVVDLVEIYTLFGCEFLLQSSFEQFKNLNFKI